MNKAKKIIALCIVLLAGGIFFAMSGAPQGGAQNIPSHGEGAGYPIENVNHTALFRAVFSTSNGEDAPAVTASYAYDLYQTTAEGSAFAYSVAAEIDFFDGTNRCAVSLEGDLEAIALGNGLTYLTGPLYGMIEIGSATYQMTAGFNKLLEREGVSFAITMVPEAPTDGEQLLSFSFGDPVITDDVLNALR